ncbi:unnamed protein product, partial [Ectocarpus sp. 13 AM-2016]
QAQGPLDWVSTSSKVKKTFTGLHRRRRVKASTAGQDAEDRVTASIAAGLSNMPEENQASMGGGRAQQHCGAAYEAQGAEGDSDLLLLDQVFAWFLCSQHRPRQPANS